MEQPILWSALKRNAGVVGYGLTHYAAMLASISHLLIINKKLLSGEL